MFIHFLSLSRAVLAGSVGFTGIVHRPAAGLPVATLATLSHFAVGLRRLLHCTVAGLEAQQEAATVVFRGDATVHVAERAAAHVLLALGVGDARLLPAVQSRRLAAAVSAHLRIAYGAAWRSHLHILAILCCLGYT